MLRLGCQGKEEKMPAAKLKSKNLQPKDTPKTVPQLKNSGSDPRSVKAVLALLEQRYPQAQTALVHHDPFQLLIATILSAQCTDERVNKVTPVLFARFPTAAALALAPREELETIIHSTGFFRAKARSIQGACQILTEQHHGEVPQEMEAMLRLPGVARKTANVVLGSAYGLITGVVVDTHVKRLAGRLGWSSATDPQEIEKDLMALVPRSRWIALSHQLILHGRALCQARRPRCSECPLALHCPSVT
jgi:endonuclease III